MKRFCSSDSASAVNLIFCDSEGLVGVYWMCKSADACDVMCLCVVCSVCVRSFCAKECVSLGALKSKSTTFTALNKLSFAQMFAEPKTNIFTIKMKWMNEFFSNGLFTPFTQSLIAEKHTISLYLSDTDCMTQRINGRQRGCRGMCCRCLTLG